MASYKWKNRKKSTSSLRVINKNAAGLDLHADSIFASAKEQPVRTFETFTDSLYQLRDYLVEHGVRTVAMEATGVYWVQVYQVLEEAGLEVCLINGAEARNLPGRKTDVKDCEWIRQLHSFGLLRASFVPEEQIRQLRSYMRWRADMIRHAGDQILHMHKALDLMNIKVHRVISDLTGASGRAIIEAILEGERNPHKLLKLCDPQIIKKKAAQVVRSLQGDWRQEQLFALKQAYQCWQFYQQKIRECDEQLGALLEKISGSKPQEQTLDDFKAMKPSKNSPRIEELHQMLVSLNGGCDATVLPGMGDYNVLKVIAEVGTDLSRWASVKHFVSWLKLAGGHNQSGKGFKRLRRHAVTPGGQIFREAAQVIGNSKDTALGAFYRRLRARKGPKVAIVATARKLATLYYRLMTKGIDYVEEGVRRYEERHRHQRIKALNRLSKELGYSLVPNATAAEVH